MRSKILAMIAAVVLPIGMAAQNGKPTAADYQNLKSTKTMVVVDDNMFSDYNAAIKTYMASDWKITEFEFISRKKFEQRKGDPSYSFLMTTNGYYRDDDSKEKYTYLSLLMGKKGAQINTMPDLISIPLCYSATTDQTYVYKMLAFMRFMLNHVEKVNNDPKLVSDSPLVQYRKDKKSLANKTLYLIKSELAKDIQSEKAIKKVYPYKFKFVGEDEIKQAIEEKDESVVFLHKVGPEKSKKKALCFTMIMGAADSQVYFFDYHKINGKNPDCLRAKDLESMAKN
ncbi:MAG: hypothetical protein II951_09625 [Bacteroidales bacterium]|jgi:hypothetical protein|nr:hypothetical protein [Bacteroidales bacterium]